MPSARRTGNLAVDIMCRVAGRRNVGRAAQFTLERLRPDVRQSDYYDSCVALQGWILDLAPPGQPVHVVDVGANVGHWSRLFLDLAESRRRLDDVDLHAFEPSAQAFHKLALELGDSTLRRIALSDRSGTMTLHTAPNSTLSSAHDIPGVHNAEEDVLTTTLDAYAQEAHLDRIDLLAIDTVGHEIAVLQGAAGLLREHRIAVIIFQRNRYWVYAGRYLRDAFCLLEPLGYRISTLTPRGVEFYPHWRSELENFSNRLYVACRQDVAGRLPRVEGLSLDWMYWHQPDV